MNILMKLKVSFKLILRYFGREQCFCKFCGSDIHYDFCAPDKFWSLIQQKMVKI